MTAQKENAGAVDFRVPLSRRSMLHAGLVPLLALRRAGGGRIQTSGRAHAAALPLEGADAGRLGLAISPDGTTAYVTFSSADVILVVDLRKGAVRSAIDTSAAGVMLGSNQAVLSADGRLLFVANLATGNVTVVDTAQERVRQVLPVNATYGDCLKASRQGKVYIGVGNGVAVVDCNDLTYRILGVSGVVFNSIALSPSRANLLYSVGGDYSRQGILSAVNLDTGLVERQGVLPKEATDQNGNLARLQVDPSDDIAYLGWNWPINSCGFGNLTAFDLVTFRVIATTPIEDGVGDFAIHPETGKVYVVGSYEGPSDGRVMSRLHITEWDPTLRVVARRLPISPSNVVSSIQLDPANPRFAYTVEAALNNLIRKVELSTGTEVMRVRFFSGDRRPSAVTTAGSLAYIACLRSPLRQQRGLATSALRGIDMTAAKDRLLITSWDGHSIFMYDLRNEKWIPRIVRVGVNPAGTAVSPDSRYLYTANYMSDTIVRMDTASCEVLEVTPLGGPVSALGAWNLRHGASLQSVPVVPGAVMAILEGNIPGEIGPPFLTTRLDASGRVAAELADTKVLFDGVPAPILYAYASRVLLVVPYSVAGKKKVTVQLIYKGEETFPFECNVADAYPGIFTMDSSGQGQAAMLNEDGTLNGSDHPAAKGSVVVFYATGLGQTDPPGVDGEITRDVLARARLGWRSGSRGSRPNCFTRAQFRKPCPA